MKPLNRISAPSDVAAAYTPDLSTLAGSDDGIKTRHFDADTTIFHTDTIQRVDRIVLGTGHDEAGNTGHIYFIELNDHDFAHNAENFTVDGSALEGDTDGNGPLYEEVAFISTRYVSEYNTVITLGDSSDRVVSGRGSDTITTGSSNDDITIGAGNDKLSLGGGDDYVTIFKGDFNARDTMDGGAGDNDELSIYTQRTADADFRNVKSFEAIGLSSGGDVVLDRFAFAAGVNSLFVDDSTHKVTVGANFTGPLLLNMYGDSSGATLFDATATTATITVHQEYILQDSKPTLLAGLGSEDTIYLSSGFTDAPKLGGDLSDTKHFENVIIHTDAGGGGAFVTLATKAGEIEANYQNVDGSALTASDGLDLQAHKSTASLHVTGGAAADTLVLGKGADLILAGGGADVLTGGKGRDVFAYSNTSDSSGTAVDTITDFHSGQDKINVSGFGAVNFVGDDASDLGSTKGDGVLDAVFQSESHTLWFDTDDNGKLDDTDLHMVLSGVTELSARDLTSHELVV